MRNWWRPKVWLQHPALVVVTSICTILGIPLSVYFYIASQPNRQLAYAVAPARTLVVDPQRASSLSMFVNTTKVSTPVSSLQFRLWNQGRQSIRPENILKPVFAATYPRVQIFEARIVQSNRDVSAMRLDVSDLKSGIVPIWWSILEHDDGATVQIIYSGRSDVALHVDGIIEGQGAVVDLTKSDAPNLRRMSRIAISGGMLGAVAAMICELLLRWHRRA